MLVVLGMVLKQWHALAQRGKPAQTPRPHPQIGGVGAAQTRLPSWLPAARSGAQPFLLAQVTLSGNANEHAQSCLFASTCGHGHCACMHARTLTRADAHPRLLPKSTPPRQTSGGALSPATRRCAGGVRRGGEPGARVETQRPSLRGFGTRGPEESRMCQLYRWEKMLVVKTLRPLQQPRKATKEVLGLSWQCGSSTPVITSGKRSAGARCVSSDVPWRSLAKIDGRRCRQGGDVGLASREPRAVHREAGHTQPGVAAVRVVRSVEPASAQTCATSA